MGSTSDHSSQPDQPNQLQTLGHCIIKYYSELDLFSWDFMYNFTISNLRYGVSCKYLQDEFDVNAWRE